MYDIIDAEKRHFPAIRELFERELSKGDIPCWSADEDDYPICMLPEDVGHSLVMLDDAGNVIAYAAYHETVEEAEGLPWKCRGKPAYFNRLLIDRDHRGKGFAQRIIEELVKRARRLGCECYRFIVYPQNEKAVGVYKKLGINCLGEAESPWAEYGDGGRILLYEVRI